MKLVKQKSHKKPSTRLLIFFAVSLLIFGASALTLTEKPSSEVSNNSNIIGDKQDKTDNSDHNPVLPELKVHFIDVGQGDSILIESDEQFLLIDAGENNKGLQVAEYLKDQRVVKLDYVIGTHPHSDHIGGLDMIINSFDIGKIIMPDVAHTTTTFEDVLDAIVDNNLKITKAVVGNTYTLADASFQIISPNGTDYEELNNYSVGIKLTHGDNTFLLTGDADELSEKEMLQSDMDLSADVLKLGHHGSITSSSEDFLDGVRPSIAVISVGKDNSYGHPNNETLQRLAERNIKVYQTDKQGTIIINSDGNNLTINKDEFKTTDSDEDETNQIPNISNNSNSKNNSNNKNDSDKPVSEKIIVHITETGNKYHKEGCRYLKNDMEITLEEALNKELEPCKVCKPPTK